MSNSLVSYKSITGSDSHEKGTYAGKIKIKNIDECIKYQLSKYGIKDTEAKMYSDGNSSGITLAEFLDKNKNYLSALDEARRQFDD